MRARGDENLRTLDGRKKVEAKKHPAMLTSISKFASVLQC